MDMLLIFMAGILYAVVGLYVCMWIDEGQAPGWWNSLWGVIFSVAIWPLVTPCLLLWQWWQRRRRNDLAF